MTEEIGSETRRTGDYLEVAPGIEIYYEGEGIPLILVPGWTFTTKVFDHQFAEFSGTHRVISFDPRSHGRSTVTLEGNNYATQAAEKVDADVPSLFFVADHWAETARPYLARHCPNSRVESFGGHMMFWEYPEKFNALLSEFLATTG